MNRARQFRELLARGGLTIVPGAYDCITARSIAQAGFDAVYMTGAGTAATLGYPDYGLVTMSEMAENAGRIASAVDVPVIAQTVTAPGGVLDKFEIDPFRKQCLLAGFDDISYTLGLREQIVVFENAYETTVRWL